MSEQSQEDTRGSRAVDFVAASCFAAVTAAGATGASEALAHASSTIEALASTGFVMLVGAPLGFALVSIGRLVWRGWRPAELAAASRVPETGGAPRLAAWAGFLALAGSALATLMLEVMKFVIRATDSSIVHALIAPIAAVLVTALLVGLSRPSVDRLARVAALVDGHLHRRLGRSLMTPRWIVAGSLAVAVGLVALAWFITIRPNIGHTDLSFLPSLALWLVALAASPAAWARLGRRRWRAALVIALVLAVAAALSSALWVRHSRPFAMLGIWGQSQIAGFMIGWLYDLEEVRSELSLQEIRPLPRPGAERRDVVLVTIDTVRADRTPPYGGSAPMPVLGRLAAQGTVFEWAFSPGNVTRRSLPSMVLGLSPPRVSGRVAGWALRLDPRHVLLAERLRAAGYATAGFFCCASHFGREHRLGLIRGIAHVVIERKAERLARLAVGWMAGRNRSSGGRPLFLWIHFIEPHDWGSDPAAQDEARPYQAYDSTLVEVDRALGLVLDEAWSPVRRGRTYVLVSSDHGEALGEHGHFTHATSLYNSEIRVPLVVAGPGIQPRRIARPVGLTDLAPTIMDLAGFEPPGMPQMDGVSFGPLLRGEAQTNAAAGEAYSAMIPDRAVAAAERALVLGHHKLIWRRERGELQLYDLAADPGEYHNLAGRSPDVQSRLAARLAARRALDAVSPF